MTTIAWLTPRPGPELAAAPQGATVVRDREAA